MKLSAGLAILASSSREDIRSDVRSMVAEWKKAAPSKHSPSMRKPQMHDTTKRERHSKIASKIASKLRKVKSEIVECDPLFVIDQDIGILATESACGKGKRCQETSFGGMCVYDEEWDFDLRGLQQQTNDTLYEEVPMLSSTEAPTSENTKEAFDPDNIVSIMQYSCDVGGLVGYDCVCHFDTATYTGNATCRTPIRCATEDSLCGVPIEDCQQTAYTVSLSGEKGVWDGELCLRFTKPYEHSVCYSTSTMDYGQTPIPECQISLDGEFCSSCEVYRQSEESIENCYRFDCSNTALAGNGRGTRIGNTCSFPAHGMDLFLDTYGCPPCDLCAPESGIELPMGTEMTLKHPNNTLVLFNTTYECSYVQDVSLQGFFTNESCRYFSSVARESCGCEMVAVPSPASCSAVEACSGFDGDCCPTTSGEFLECCEILPTQEPTTTTPPTSHPTQEPTTTNPTVAETPCPICPEGVPVLEGLITMPGGSEISCAEIQVAGMKDGNELCEAVQQQALGPCCGIENPQTSPPPSVEEEVRSCSICGPGKKLTNPTNDVSVPTQGIFRCEELVELGKNGILDNYGICALAQASAQTPCGCIVDGPTDPPSTATLEEIESSSSVSNYRISPVACLLTAFAFLFPLI